MRKSYLFILLCFSSILINAQTYVAAPTKQKLANLSYTLAYDTVKSINNNEFYNLCYSASHKGGKTQVLFYNKAFNNSFELCTNGTIDTCLAITPDFLTTRGSVYAVYLQSPDSLFALTKEYIYCFNSKGVVHSKIDFNTSLNKQFKNYKLSFLQKEKPFYYSSKTGCFYINLVNQKLNKGLQQQLKKNEPVFLEFNPLTDTWRDVGARYSELFRHRYYDIAIEYFSTFTGDAILYNFQVEPNIYKYSLSKGTIETIGGASSYADSLPKGFKSNKAANRQDAFSWFIRIPWYNSPVLFDPYKKLYYRLYFDDIPLKKSDGLFAGQFDKTPVLMVFDDSFNLLKEFELPVGKIVGGKLYVSPKGLHLDMRTQQGEHKVYCIVNVE